jgi:beta-lactamase class D
VGWNRLDFNWIWENDKERKMNFFFAVMIAIAGLQMTVNSCDIHPIKTVFIAKKSGEALKEEGSCDLQKPPCSTFKVPLALMGFDSGILKNVDSPIENLRARGLRSMCTRLLSPFLSSASLFT